MKFLKNGSNNNYQIEIKLHNLDNDIIEGTYNIKITKNVINIKDLYQEIKHFCYMLHLSPNPIKVKFDE